MLRVIIAQSAGNDTDTISTHKTNLKDRISNAGYDLNEYAVNDGTNEDGDPTLGLNLKFNSSTDAETEWYELRDFFNNNSGDFQWARMTLHDCEHNTNGNLPCELGDTWNL